MDPITAIGLASAIVTFVDIGAKVTKRLRELSSEGNVPEVFRDIRTRLPLIISTVVSTQQNNTDLGPEAQEAFEEVVRQCFEQVKQLEEIIRKVTATKGDSTLKKAFRAGLSLVEETRVERIAASLRDNVQLLTFINVTPAENGSKSRPTIVRRPSEPLPSYASATGAFLVPFSRDEHFVGREEILQSIYSGFAVGKRLAISGIGGVGKSQVTIEYCYRYKESNPDAHVLWVYGGNVARFYQGYKRIAQTLQIPGWDDPEESILDLVSVWLSTTNSSYLLVVDNADNIEHWWPSKYNSTSSSTDPSNNLSKYLPDASDRGRVLITTRDNRVANRLVKQPKPIALLPMSKEEAKALFLSKTEAEPSDLDESEISNLLEELDHLPLAVSQAAAFIEQNGISVAEYTSALHSNEAEEFLHEELDDDRRDEESVNSVFRTWRLSYDQIRQQKPRAADILSLLAMLDRQSIPKSLLKLPEVTTSITVLQSFNLITSRPMSQNVQMHRLVQRFVQISLEREKIAQKWHDVALACVSKEYPTEIGVAEWPICDALAPHVQLVLRYEHKTIESRLDLAHLLCWAADFDIELGLYTQALQRAECSLKIYTELVPERDERLASATWLYGRLRFYEAKSDSDMSTAAELLEKALRISEYPSLNYAESAFELAHLYYDQRNETACLEMGKASFECWKAMEGSSSVRTLDNMHDYALELALLGHEAQAITMWQEILDHCRGDCQFAENTKAVFTYRTMASMAEFEDDPSMAEILYAKVIKLCTAIYNPDHVHVFDYRLSHAEQIMRQGRLEEAIQLSEAIMADCNNKSEWQILDGCLQTMAECYRLKACYPEEETFRQEALALAERNLGKKHRCTFEAKEALADCYMNRSKYVEAKDLYEDIFSWRQETLGQTHSETLRSLECLAFWHAKQANDAEAETKYVAAVNCQSGSDARLLNNLCTVLWNQNKWETVEATARQMQESEDDAYQPAANKYLVTALEQQGKLEEAMTIQAGGLSLEVADKTLEGNRRLPDAPPVREERRFGRMIHPRTWSA